MKFRFKTKELELLYTENKDANKYPAEVVDRFFALMDRIDTATSEVDFYLLKSLHYEKLKGNRAGQRSMRLNRQWRLILSIETSGSGQEVLLISIENHYAK